MKKKINVESASSWLIEVDVCKRVSVDEKLLKRNSLCVTD